MALRKAEIGHETIALALAIAGIGSAASAQDWNGASIGLQTSNSSATDRIVVGLEYLLRNLTSENFVETPSSNIKSDFSTVSLRVAFIL